MFVCAGRCRFQALVEGTKNEKPLEISGRCYLRCSSPSARRLRRRLQAVCVARSRTQTGSIPGVTVELVNEATNVARDVVSNDQGLYNFAAVAPGVYTIKASLTGFKSYEQKGVRIAAQQFVTIDVSMEVGALQETITVTGEAPLIDTSTASTGGGHQHRAAEHAAERRPVGLPVRRHGADGGRVRRLAVQPPAGSDQRVAAVARRRHAPRQQLPDRRRAGHRPAQPRVGEPHHRRPRGRRRAGAHLRRGDGAHRRRHLQHRHQVAAPTASPAAASTRPVRAGAWPTTSSPSWRASRCRRPISTSVAAASAARSSRTARSSGSRWKATARTPRATARCASRPRASAPATSRRRSIAQGSLVVIYDPLTGDAERHRPHAVPGQHHPGQPHQPGRPQPGQHLPDADARRQRRQHQLREHGRDRRPRR